MCLFGGGAPSAPVNPASTSPADAYTTVTMTETKKPTQQAPASPNPTTTKQAAKPSKVGIRRITM